MKRIKPPELRLRVLCFLMAVVLPIAFSTHVLAEGSKMKINTNWFGVAIKGYDPVAYFTEGRAVKGKKEFELKWQGAMWHFSNAANKDKFTDNPQAYAPQYGGF
jgi:YHS domain-containing protein